MSRTSNSEISATAIWGEQYGIGIVGAGANYSHNGTLTVQASFLGLSAQGAYNDLNGNLTISIGFGGQIGFGNGLAAFAGLSTNHVGYDGSKYASLNATLSAVHGVPGATGLEIAAVADLRDPSLFISGGLERLSAANNAGLLDPVQYRDTSGYRSNYDMQRPIGLGGYEPSIFDRPSDNQITVTLHFIDSG